MRLTQADYRAALLMNYRNYRALGESKRIAFRCACMVTQPLPDDEQSILLRDALQCFRAWESNGSNDDLPSARRLRLNWRISWTLTRSAFSETR